MSNPTKRIKALGAVAAGMIAVLAVTSNSVTAGNAAQTDRATTFISDIDGGKVASPDLWNPFVPGARRDHGFHQLMLEPLFMLNYMTGKIEPWLGVSMTADKSLKVWTLKLNPKAAWSDGVPFTADDVVWTVETAKKVKEWGGDAAGVRDWVTSVKKVNANTVEFTLRDSNPRFQLDYFSVKIWGSMPILPKHIWENKDPLTYTGAEPGKPPVFTGAYKIKSHNADGTEFIYERDDNWWAAKAGFKPLPAPKTVIFTWLGSVENRAAAMADGKIDSLDDITLGAFQAIQAKNKTAIAWYDKAPWAILDPCSRVFAFNTTLKPWDDSEMRWAINYAINRDQIVTIAYENTTSKSRMPYPMYPPIQRLDKLANSKGLYQKYDIWTSDPKKAQAIFEKKGYVKGADGYYAKDGKQLSLVINTHDAFIEKQRITDVMVEQLQAVGVNASHVKQAGQLWGDNLQFGKFEAQMGWQNCGSVNEPWATLDTLNARWIKPVGERANQNGFRWNNKVYSDAVDAMGKLPLGDPKIDALFLTAYEQYLKELPTIPITQAKKLIPFSQTVWTNFPTDKNKYDASWNWWQTFMQVLTRIKPVAK